jgi:hypothetical protein
MPSPSIRQIQVSNRCIYQLESIVKQRHYPQQGVYVEIRGCHAPVIDDIAVDEIVKEFPIW